MGHAAAAAQPSAAVIKVLHMATSWPPPPQSQMQSSSIIHYVYCAYTSRIQCPCPRPCRHCRLLYIYLVVPSTSRIHLSARTHTHACIIALLLRYNRYMKNQSQVVCKCSLLSSSISSSCYQRPSLKRDDDDDKS